MKILFVNKFFFNYGGAETVFFDTAKMLQQKGHQVNYFSMHHKKNYESIYAKYFVSNIDYEDFKLRNLIIASSKILYSIEAKKKIEKLIRFEKPDLAHIHNIYHQISPSILTALKKNNIPVVMTLHDYKLVCASYTMLHKKKVCELCMNRKYYHCLLARCVKNSILMSFLNTFEMYLHHKIMKIYDMVDTFISPSEFLKAKFRNMGFNRKVIYLPNFIDTEKIKPVFNSKEKSILFIGRLIEHKGVLNLIKAMKGLKLNLKIIGDGPIKNEMKNVARKFNIHNVKFLRHMNTNDLYCEIQKSMFCVLPAEWYENNPRTVVESFAFGKPVIGARIGGIPEMIKEDKNGLTFVPGDVNDLRSKIEYLIANPEKIVEMGSNAREFVVNELGADRHYKQLMKIYFKCLKRGSNRDLI